MTALASERVIVQAPMSYVGSTRRIWRIGENLSPAWRVALAVLLLSWLTVTAWVVVTVWYGTFGLLLLPFRFLRRGDRLRRRQALQHREALAAAARRDV